MKKYPSCMGRVGAAAVICLMLVSCDQPSPTTLNPEFAKLRWTRITKVSGDGQTGVIGSVLPESVTVQVRDRRGGVSGVAIQWTIKSGGGTADPVQSTTNANGIAKASWTLGPVGGTNTLEAAAAGIGTVTFSATATVSPQSGGIVTKVEITPAHATLEFIGAQTTLTATAYDENGQVISGQSFDWSSLNTGVATVDATGSVTARGVGSALIVAIAAGVADTATINVTSSGSVTGAFYVSTTGSDAAAGTQASPWRTIGFAVTKLQPGQTLYVRGGTYQENIKNPGIQPGRPDARIRVAAYPGERPVIQGLLWLTRPSYWTIDGINVTWLSSNLATDHMVKMTNGVGWIYENAELWGARSFAGLLVYGSVSGEPADWVIRGNCIHDIWTDPIHHTNGDHNLYINTGTSAGAGLIERNILFNAPNGQNVKLGYGRSTPQPGDGAANVTVRYNTMYSSLKPLMVADESRNNIIENNIIVLSSERYAIRAYRLTGAGNIFRNNVFFQFDRLQYGDAGYLLVTDGGGNHFPLDPQFDGVGCSALRPQNTTAQAYGRYAN